MREHGSGGAGGRNRASGPARADGLAGHSEPGIMRPRREPGKSGGAGAWPQPARFVQSPGLAVAVAPGAARAASAIYVRTCVSSTGSGTEPWARTTSWNLRTSKRVRSEEHTSELQSLMRISYAVLCLKKKKKKEKRYNSA